MSNLKGVRNAIPPCAKEKIRAEGDQGADCYLSEAHSSKGCPEGSPDPQGASGRSSWEGGGEVPKRFIAKLTRPEPAR